MPSPLRPALVLAYRRFVEIRDDLVDPSAPSPDWPGETRALADAVRSLGSIDLEVDGLALLASVDDATGLLRFDAAALAPIGGLA